MSRCTLGVFSIALFIGSIATPEKKLSGSCRSDDEARAIHSYEPLLSVGSLAEVIAEHSITDHLAYVQKKAAKVHEQIQISQDDGPTASAFVHEPEDASFQAEPNSWERSFADSIGNYPDVYAGSDINASFAPLTWAYMPSPAEAAPCGPNMWHVIDGAEACAEVGTQSPIDCPIMNATKHPSFSPKDLQLSRVGDCQSVEYHLNEHTVEMEFAPPTCNKALKATWEGKDFYLQSFHYHSPSEHMWDGGYFPLEVHHVHKADDDQALVIAVMVSVTRDLNNADLAPARFLEDIFVKIPLPGKDDHEHNRFDSSQAASRFWNPYANFIPSLEEKFFIYEGSFETPPCEKNVLWAFPAKVVTIPHSSLDIFRELINADPLNQLAAFGRIVGNEWNATPSWHSSAGEVSWDPMLRANIRPIQKLLGRDDPERTFFVIESDAAERSEGGMQGEEHQDSDESNDKEQQAADESTSMQATHGDQQRQDSDESNANEQQATNGDQQHQDSDESNANEQQATNGDQQHQDSDKFNANEQQATNDDQQHQDSDESNANEQQATNDDQQHQDSDESNANEQQAYDNQPGNVRRFEDSLGSDNSLQDGTSSDQSNNDGNQDQSNNDGNQADTNFIPATTQAPQESDHGSSDQEQQRKDNDIWSDQDLMIPATTQQPHEGENAHQEDDVHNDVPTLEEQHQDGSAQNQQQDNSQQDDSQHNAEPEEQQQEGSAQNQQQDYSPQDDDQHNSDDEQQHQEIGNDQPAESVESDGLLTGSGGDDDLLGPFSLDSKAAAEQLRAAGGGPEELDSLHTAQGGSHDVQEEEMERSYEPLKWVYGRTDNCSPDQSACGENTWATNFAQCGDAAMQSPINLQTSTMTDDPALSTTDLKMEVMNDCSDAEFLLNEHTVEVELIGPCRHAYKLTWKQKEFYLVQFHYHSPSEHTLDGGYFPLEVNHVHKSADSQSVILTVFGAVNLKPKSEADAQRGSFLMDVFLKIPKPDPDDHEHNRFQQIKRGALVNPYESFVPSLEDGFYYYEGTFSSPPCINAAWIIAPEAVTISQSSLDMYRELVNADPINQLADFESITHIGDVPPWNNEAGAIDWDTSLKCNIRSIQPLNGEHQATERQLYKISKPQSQLFSSRDGPVG